MSLTNLFIRLFITKSVLISAVGSFVFASLTHFVIVLYIVTHIFPDKQIMDKALKFIENNRENP